MKLRQSLGLLIVVAMSAILASCGGSPANATSSTLKAITVAIGSVPTALSTNASVALTATVTNDPSNAGVKWSVTCPSTVTDGCGVFSNITATAATYTAPVTVPTGRSVIITATSVTAPDASPSATITIMAITVAIPGAPTSLLTSAAANLTATVNNDTTNAGVTWSLSCGTTVAGACGALSNPTTTTVTYTAPPAIPSGKNITIIATSITEPTVRAVINITIAVITVTLSGAPPSLATGGSAPLTATVTGDPANAGVSWSLTCGSAAAGACGGLSNTNPTSTTYTAPATIPPGGTVTITATSLSDATKSGSASIAIMGISVTLTGAPAFLQVNGTAAITATVNNDAVNAGVTWALSCGSGGAACGALSNITTTSATYTAPATVPNPATITITATSISDTTQSAAAVITITPPSLADGTYVFSLAGSNGSPYFLEGAFVVSGGLITNGEQDYVNSGSYIQDIILNGTQSVTADGNFQLVLTTLSSGNETINGALVSITSARIIEFDGGVTSNGRLDLQATPVAAPTAGYAFSISGLDSGSVPAALGGVLNITSSGTISGKGSVFDINDQGGVGVLQAQTFQASTISPPDNLGRVVFTLNPSAASGVSNINLAGYIVDATRIPLVETANDSYFGTLGGVALGQGKANTGTFNTASISGSSFVFGLTGSDSSSANDQAAGLLTTNSDGTTVNGLLNFNDLTGTASTTPTAFTGTYTIDSTGRVTLSNLTDSNGVFNFTLQFYLNGTGQGSQETAVSMDTTDVLAGRAWQQTGGGSFTASSFSGNYILDATGVDPNNMAELDIVGAILANGNGTLAGTVDLNSNAYGVFPGLPMSGMFNAQANGAFTGTINGIDATNCVTINSSGIGCTDDVFSYYAIDTTKVLAIETDPNQLTIGLFTLKQ